MSTPTVAVSGAGTGIGRAVARRLVTGGFHVTMVGRHSGPLSDPAAELRCQDGTGSAGESRVDLVPADVATAACAAAVAAHIASPGRPCAGVVCSARRAVPVWRRRRRA
ncbi:MAG TPA: SDR family NAD(P)-dependent oxidoreductase [Streptosporangiaceae bacterium]|nr:SDR family NAD(P)-dependent oxidoreductase [Streptosporangiaceae bacterium]